MTRQRLTRALAGACASVLAAASLAVVGAVVSAPAANAVTTGGTPWTWGDNSSGQLGNNSTTSRRTPAAVNGGLNDVVDLHGGREFVVALRSDGSVWTWGSNANGQLGLNTTANALVPTKVPTLASGVTAVTSGHNFMMALKSDGTVWESGLNTDGQLGDGTTTQRRAPVQVKSLGTAVDVAGGRDMSYALLNNGQVWGWGRNAEGEMGDGTTTRRLAPVRVGTLTNVAAVAGGRDHALALLSDGSVWAWGENTYGQVGDNTTTNRTAPVKVISSGIVAVAAGADHSYALKSDGTVLSWGRDYRDELGDGNTSTASRKVPGPVVGVTNATTLGSGRDFGVVTTSAGHVQTWGYNATGQLGDGTTTNRASAVTVPGISNATRSAGGGQGYSVVLVGGSAPPNQDPVARISGTTCTDLSCPLSGGTSTDDGTIVSYDWDFGDGNTGSGISPGHTYTAGGSYLVSLTVTDDQGATDTATATVNPTDPGTNQDPVAHITGTTCTNLTCPLSGSSSTDDGTIVGYAWDFGDGNTGSGADGTHTYAGAGTWTVTLTVTDNDGATDTDTAQVTTTASQSPNPSFRAQAATDANTASASVVVPSTVQVGDQLVLVATTNTGATQTTPAGWTLLGTAADGTDVKSQVYTRTAAAGVPGSTIRVAVSATSKTSLSLVAYANASPITTVASAVQGTATVTAHPAPAVSVARAGSTVLRYWSDKNSSARTWTTPAGETRRTSTAGTGGGSLATVSADEAGVAAGTAPSVSATCSLGSAKAVAWSIVVPHTP